MYRTLSIALLIVVFGLLAIRSTGLSASGQTSPQIIQTVVVQNRTTPLGPATLFTPPKTGLYRISGYLTQTVIAGDDSWNCNLSWSDDAGAEITSNGQFLSVSTEAGPPRAYSQNTYTIEAIAGQPVTFTVTVGEGRGGGYGAYTLYFTVEKLI